MRIPGLAAIQAAEHQLERSRRNTSACVHRLRTGGRAYLARPSTLAAVAGASALMGYWISRGRAPRPAPPAGSSAAVATRSALGIVTAFMVRYGLEHLPSILRQTGTILHSRAAAAGADGDEQVRTA